MHYNLAKIEMDSGERGGFGVAGCQMGENVIV